MSLTATTSALPGLDSRTESGNIQIENRTYHYDCVLSASTTQFTARMTYEYYDVYISCEAKPYINYLGAEYSGDLKRTNGQGSIRVSGGADLPDGRVGTISWVRGTFKIRTTVVATIELR